MRNLCISFEILATSGKLTCALLSPQLFNLNLRPMMLCCKLLMANKMVTLIKGVSMNITAPGAKITCTTFFITPSVSGGRRTNLKASNPFPSADSQ